MTQPPVARNIPRSMKSPTRQSGGAEAAWSRFVAMITNPDLIMIVAFCMIGLLVTVNVILRFPDFGLTAEQLAFP